MFIEEELQLAPWTLTASFHAFKHAHAPPEPETELQCRTEAGPLALPRTQPSPEP